MSMTLTEFLTARLDEDEAVAREALTDLDVWPGESDEGVIGGGADVHPSHLAFTRRLTPTRVLADVVAKRRIVEGHADSRPDLDYLAGVWASEDHTLRLLALPYADHPDFRKEWHA